jgi:NADPH-dependent ferric siderophore reductase
LARILQEPSILIEAGQMMSEAAVAERPARRSRRVRRETSVVYAEVVRVEQYRPRVRRITLRSAEFDGWITDVPDQFITFIFPMGDRKRPAVGRHLDWDDYFKLDESERPHARNYTVRAWRPDVLEVDVDMILHGDEGRGSIWAMEAEPGDALAIWGPRTAYDPPPNVTWQLLFGDETGLPAIAVILEQLPAGSAARVIVEVDGPECIYPLESPADLEVTWLYRGDEHPGKSEALIDAVRAVALPEGVCYAWGGGEFRTMQALGKYLRRECGFRPSDVTAIGYW